jgi:hypothetical protein
VNDLKTFADTREGALALFRELAKADLVAKLEQGLAAGTLVLRPDPWVSGVWGAVRPDTLKVMAIIYLKDADFEVDGEWE